MYSDEFLYRYARDRMKETQREAERARQLPSFRTRLALTFQALAERLEPELAKAPKPVRNAI